MLQQTINQQLIPNKGGFMSGGLMKGLMLGGLAGLLFGSLFANMGCIRFNHRIISERISDCYHYRGNS